MNEEQTMDIQAETIAMAGEPAEPRFKLYPLKHVLWSSVFGGPLAGTWMIAANFKRLGAIKRSYVASAIGGAAVALVMVIGITIGRRFGGMGNLSLGGALGVATHMIAKRYQGTAIEIHSAQGGRFESALKSVGITLLGLVQALLGAGVLVSWLQTTVVVGPGGAHKIILDGMATESDAKRVGAVLTDIGLLRDGQQSQMTLTRERAKWTLSMTVTKEGIKDLDVAEVFGPVAIALRERVFSGSDLFLLVFQSEYGVTVKTCEVTQERRVICR